MAIIVGNPFVPIYIPALSNIDRLEKVQQKAVRFAIVCSDFSSVTHNILCWILTNYKHWLTLKSRRDNLRLAIMYKIFNNLVEVEADSPTRGHWCKFKQPFTRVNSHKINTLYPR